MASDDLTRWIHLRSTLVHSQLAPTGLLITTIALLQFGLAQTPLAVRIATAGILLASGILGALVQFQSAHEAQTLAKTLDHDTGVTQSAQWLWVVKFVTPTIFIIIYVALMAALFL
jgi:hypothetical protein